jgi:hypothetical protein
MLSLLLVVEGTWVRNSGSVALIMRALAIKMQCTIGNIASIAIIKQYQGWQILNTSSRRERGYGSMRSEKISKLLRLEHLVFEVLSKIDVIRVRSTHDWRKGRGSSRTVHPRWRRRSRRPLLDVNNR